MLTMVWCSSRSASEFAGKDRSPKYFRGRSQCIRDGDDVCHVHVVVEPWHGSLVQHGATRA
jgi:hypothetical protein